MVIEAILWRRLDTPGHDACQLEQTGSGWKLDGAAIFLNEDVPACLAYRVTCDPEWRTREGILQGWVGNSPVSCRFARTGNGIWMLNGEVLPNLEGCLDLDFDFTPATNLFQLRRIALQVGQKVEVPVAWWDMSMEKLNVLYQLYERCAEGIYRYESPRFGYAALLEVRQVGFVQRYPGLWEAESSSRLDS